MKTPLVGSQAQADDLAIWSGAWKERSEGQTKVRQEAELLLWLRDEEPN